MTTDEVYLAVVVDVIVAPDARGRGLGGMLVDAIVGHLRLAAVRSVELVCQPDLMTFYHRWGFTQHIGQSDATDRGSTANRRLIRPTGSRTSTTLHAGPPGAASRRAAWRPGT